LKENECFGCGGKLPENPPIIVGNLKYCSEDCKKHSDKVMQEYKEEKQKDIDKLKKKILKMFDEKTIMTKRHIESRLSRHKNIMYVSDAIDQLEKEKKVDYEIIVIYAKIPEQKEQK